MGGASVATTVELYALANGEDQDGTRYTKYRGDDGNYYVENHDTRQIVRT